MKGFRFFLEYPTSQDKNKATRKELGNHKGTCIAVNTYDECFVSSGQWCYDAIGAVQDIPNSPCCSTAASWIYLNSKCKRISEKEARRIHPALFEYLEN